MSHLNILFGYLFITKKKIPLSTVCHWFSHGRLPGYVLHKTFFQRFNIFKCFWNFVNCFLFSITVLSIVYSFLGLVSWSAEEESYFVFCFFLKLFSYLCAKLIIFLWQKSLLWALHSFVFLFLLYFTCISGF